MGFEFVLRFIGGILAGVTAFQLLSTVVDLSRGSYVEVAIVYVFSCVGFGIAYVLTPYVTTRPFFWIRHQIYQATASDIVAAGIGLAFGFLTGALLAVPLSFLPGLVGRFLPVVASGVMAYFGIVTMLTHRQAIFGMLGFRRPSLSAGGQTPNRPLLVDSSAIIDGRIADVSTTGFVGGTLVVPRFVLEEVQHIADSADPLRRNRGRRGLEVIERLQREAGCPVEISDVDVDNAVGVDAKLVRLARTMSCAIITNDYNLNHVAQIQGVEVLNVNLLANALRTSVVQGEEMSVRIVQEGREPGQGVAFLDDGTMIVVESGRQAINSEVDVVVAKVLQTAAGRMIFARLKPASNGSRKGPHGEPPEQ
jgi:uncharacterized protein YacL